MPKVDCFEISGLTCWFWSHDHEPPHFHAKRDGEWEVKVHFTLADEEMIKFEWGKAPGSKLLKQLKRTVARHRADLLAEWEAKVNR